MTTTHLSLPAEAPETYEELVRLYPPIVVVLERPEGSANCANFGWVGLDSRAGRDYCPSILGGWRASAAVLHFAREHTGRNRSC